jgi:transcriptional regulator with XRE-family HTH domain
MPKRKKRSSGRSTYSRTGFLKRLRLLCGGHSFDELEVLTGINRETIRRQVRGQNRPTAEHAARVCETFSASADWLLFGRGPQQRRK